MSTMRRFRRRAFLGGAVAGVAALAAACGGDSKDDKGSSSATGQGAAGTQASAASSGPEKEQVLRIPSVDEPPFMDPAMATDGSSLSNIRQVFVGLVRFDKELKVVPWAA